MNCTSLSEVGTFNSSPAEGLLEGMKSGCWEGNFTSLFAATHSWNGPPGLSPPWTKKEYTVTVYWYINTKNILVEQGLMTAIHSDTYDTFDFNTISGFFQFTNQSNACNVEGQVAARTTPLIPQEEHQIIWTEPLHCSLWTQQRTAAPAEQSRSHKVIETPNPQYTYLSFHPYRYSKMTELTQLVVAWAHSKHTDISGISFT